MATPNVFRYYLPLLLCLFLGICVLHQKSATWVLLAAALDVPFAGLLLQCLTCFHNTFHIVLFIFRDGYGSNRMRYC